MISQNTLCAKECAELILEATDPIVVMHSRPDGDTVGTGAALMAVLRALGKEPRYACSDPIPERLAFLVEGYLAAEPPYVGEAIAVDIPSFAQLGALGEVLIPKFVIDHHEFGSPFAPVYVVHGASSAAEVLYGVINILIDMGKITLTKEIAYPLYAAISSDTGCFCYSNTAPSTYRLAATLAEVGIDYADINHRLFNSKSEKQLKSEGIIATKIRTADSGRIAYATISKAERDAAGIEAEHFETAIDVVRSLRGAEVAFVVKENDRGEFKASLRSTGMNVAEIAAEFGGGGHMRAAGCTVARDSVDSAAEALLEAILSKRS